MEQKEFDKVFEEDYLVLLIFPGDDEYMEKVNTITIVNASSYQEAVDKAIEKYIDEESQSTASEIALVTKLDRCNTFSLKKQAIPETIPLEVFRL